MSFFPLISSKPTVKMNAELLDYFDGDELSASVWLRKYALKGEVTPDDMHRRMAKQFARIEHIYQKKETSTKKLSKYDVPTGQLCRRHSEVGYEQGDESCLAKLLQGCGDSSEPVARERRFMDGEGPQGVEESLLVDGLSTEHARSH